MWTPGQMTDARRAELDALYDKFCTVSDAIPPMCSGLPDETCDEDEEES